MGASERLREQVSLADRNRCAYCQTSEANPRAQSWLEHFRWSADAIRIEGLTAIGRATIIALRMNREAILATRARWVWGGWHPPID